MPAQEPHKNWAERWVDRTRRRPVLVILFFLVTSVASTVAIGGWTVSGVRWLRTQVLWREAEYAKLQTLKAGFSNGKFTEVLGSPLFRRPARKGKLVENTYRGRDFWVQTVEDPTGRVVLYAITSCSWEFKPNFEIIGQNPHIQLNVSTLGDARADEAHYFSSPATANSYYFDEYYGGNPSNYQTFVWGLNDACPDWFDETKRRFSGKDPSPMRPGLKYPDGDSYKGPIRKREKWISRFRSTAIVNTFAQTAPGVYLKDVLPSFQVGVDRILVRTVYPAPSLVPELPGQSDGYGYGYGPRA